jgi:hypothetical protein
MVEELESAHRVTASIFDAHFCLQKNRDMAARVDHLVHFLKHGWREARNPSATCNMAHYLRAYPDVAANFAAAFSFRREIQPLGCCNPLRDSGSDAMSLAGDRSLSLLGP